MTKHDKATARLVINKGDFDRVFLDINNEEVARFSTWECASDVAEKLNNYDNLKATNEKLVEALREVKEDCEVRQQSGDCGNYDLEDDNIWVLVTQLLNEIEKGDNNG